ncbi:hypothetical protein AAF712_012188 [Marasmius tenuissimus]|uniref:F-box domain-containing protein n=1 Tax=Marasmius tenuissimus TaxID=585030 RepID=A0ABR2ZI46_9AGAR
MDRVLFIENYHEQGSHHDSETILQHLPAIQSDIAHLNSEITRLKSALTSLENYRERLNRCVAIGKSLIPPPVHRLPSELLSHIFKVICDDGPISELSSSNLRYTPPPPPVRMSAVCAYWRAIALSTSNLWSAVKFALELSPNTNVERLHRMTERFITRARTSPLTIAFEIPEGQRALDPGDPFTVVVNHAVEVLCERSFQWLDVELHVPSNFFLLPAIRGIRGNLPNLRNISICDLQIPLASTYILFDGGCPALRAMTIHMLGEQEDIIFQTIPWQQVEDLKLGDFRPNLARSPLYLVTLCPKLISLNLDYNLEVHQPSVDHFTGHVTSNMESLTLMLKSDYNEAQDTWVEFFDHITLPRLSSLTLQGTYSTHQFEDISSILQCVTRSACPITSLTLRFNLLSMTENHRLLSLLPSLTTLALYEDWTATYSKLKVKLDRVKDFSRLLYVDSGSPASTTQLETPHLLPRLHQVSFDLPNFHDPKTLLCPLFDSDQGVDGNLYRTVASRWLPDRREAVVPRGGVDSLQSVTIMFANSWRRRPNLPDLAKLRKLGEEGLEVFIRDKDS